MSELRATLGDYLALRAQLGRKDRGLRRCLRSFVDFAEHEGTCTITADLAVRWATEPEHAQPSRWAQRLGYVRGFACYASAFDVRTQIPPKALLPHRYRRKEAYLYSDEEVNRLLEAAQQLPSPSGLRGATYRTALGLWTVTGIRPCELIALQRSDVDLEEGVLSVRHSKFDTSRLLPIHSSTVQALQRYAHKRDAIWVRPRTRNFFLSERGEQLSIFTVDHTFRRLCQKTGLDRAAGKRRKPRLMDFRHRFAVQTLLRWYKAGIDVQSCLLQLSTYLGHVSVANTYWYLTATPELLDLARSRQKAAGRGRQ